MQENKRYIIKAMRNEQELITEKHDDFNMAVAIAHRFLRKYEEQASNVIILENDVIVANAYYESEVIVDYFNNSKATLKNFEEYLNDETVPVTVEEIEEIEKSLTPKERKRSAMQSIIDAMKVLEELEPAVEWCWASLEDIQESLYYMDEDDE